MTEEELEAILDRCDKEIDEWVKDRDNWIQLFEKARAEAEKIALDRDNWKNRAKIFKEAIKGTEAACRVCVHYLLSFDDLPCNQCCGFDTHWQFDEARFAAEG